MSRGPDELVAGPAGDGPDRRRLRWVLGALAAVVALAVLRPDLDLGSRPSALSPPTASATSTSGLPSFQPRLLGIDWPSRGELRFSVFVRHALRRVREERRDANRLFWAGHLPDGSRLVLAGTDVNRGVVASSVHALHVPAGGDVYAADVVEAGALTDRRQVLAWAAEGADGRVRVVVLVRPGRVRLELSPGVDFNRHNGNATRRWTLVAAQNGVVVADLGTEVDPVVAIRAFGRDVFGLPMVVRVMPAATTPSALAVGGVDDAGYRGPALAELSRGLRDGVGEVVDLDAAASIDVLWSGAPWKQRRLALVLVTRDDGQRLQALVGQDAGRAYPLGVRALAAQAPDRLPWLLEPFSPQDPTLLLCPTGPGSVIYSRPGSSASTLSIGADGVVALVPPGPSPPSTAGAEVVVTDEHDRILIRTTLPPVGYADRLLDIA